MGKQHLALRGTIGGSDSTIFKEVPEMPYLEKKIRFSLKCCNVEDYCIRKLEDGEITSLYRTLGTFEEITWGQIRQMPREKGFSIEKKGDGNHVFLSRTYPLFNSFLHFRVTGVRTPFRVFGAMKEDLCYLLLLDPEGAINH